MSPCPPPRLSIRLSRRCATSKETSKPSPTSTCSMKRDESPRSFLTCNFCLQTHGNQYPPCPRATSSVATSTPTAARSPSYSTNTTSAPSLSSITTDVSSGSSTPNRSSPSCEPPINDQAY